MKRLLLILTAVFILACGAHAASLSDADKLYAESRWQQAYDEYAKVSASAAGETKNTAVLRKAQCLVNLGRYDAAVTELYAEPLPKDAVWKARFLLTRAHLADNVASVYHHALPQDEYADAEKVDSQTLTEEQLKTLQEQDYNALWDMRKTLAKRPLTDETLIIDIQDRDLETVPTLFDFTLLKIKDYILSDLDRNAPRLNPADFTAADYKGKDSPSWDLQKLAFMLEESYKMKTLFRAYAADAAKLERINLPLAYPHMFDAVMAEDTAKTLLELAGYNKPKRLFNFIPSALSDKGKARAVYTAADIYNSRLADYQKAHDLASYIANNFSGGEYYTQQAKAMIALLEQKTLSQNSLPASPNPKDNKITVNVKNVDNVYVRIYRTNPDELKKLYENRYEQKNLTSHLKNLTRKGITTLILESTPAHEFAQEINYDKKYALQTAEIKLPELENGLYVIILSYMEDFNKEYFARLDRLVKEANKKNSYTTHDSYFKELEKYNQDAVTAAIQNISNIMLAGRGSLKTADPSQFVLLPGAAKKTLKPTVAQFFTLDPLSGKPEADVNITALLSRNTQSKSTETSTVKMTTSAQGAAEHAENIVIAEQSYTSGSLDPLAEKHGNYAFLQNNLHFNYSAQTPFRIFIETDRAVYRPGQTVQAKATLFERTAAGWKTPAAGKYNLAVTLRDANWQEVNKETKAASDMGTAAFSFKLPQSGLLGRYSAEVVLQDKNRSSALTSTSVSFSVEEYKRPEFEVNLEEAAKPWVYDAPARVQGNAKYYFGSPVAEANVEYTVTRKEYIPFFWWWWRMPLNTAEEEVLQGKTLTKHDGTFDFEFTPKEKLSVFSAQTSQYTVKVNIYDAGGRVIKAERSYLASKNPHTFKVDMDEGFFTAGKEISFPVSLVDITGKPAQGDIYGSVSLLEDVYQNEDNLAGAFGATKEKENIYSFKAASSEGKAGTAKLPPLKEGVYRLTLKTEENDTNPHHIIFLAVKNGKSLKLPPVAIAQKSAYYPGETALVLIGTDKIANAKYTFVTQNEFTLDSKVLAEPGVSLIKIPVKEAHRGGFNAEYFAVTNYKAYKGGVRIEVPFNNKELSVKLNLPAEVKPGQETQFSLEVKDYKGNPVNGEATLKIYDKSLDYYVSSSAGAVGAGLYSPSYYRGAQTGDSLFSQHPFIWGSPKYISHPEVKPLPSLITEFVYHPYSRSTWGRGGKTFSGAMAAAPMMEFSAQNSASFESGAMARTAAPMAPMAMKSMAVADAAVEEAAAGVKTDSGAALAGVSVRENMAETALWAPQTKVTAGKAGVSFKMPERLSSWQASADVITKDALLGYGTIQTVTKKDLMVRLETPRFFRENDKGVIKAVVNNETDAEMLATVTLLVQDDGRDAYGALGITNNSQRIVVPAQSQAAAEWEAAPLNTAALTLTAVARAGTESDAELKKLPVLPSRQRLAESKVIFLKDGANTLKLTRLAAEKDETRLYENISLRIDPNLLLNTLNSMPLLLSYPYETVPSLVTQYVPLAIINSFYEKYPELKKEVAKMPKRATITPAWEEDDPSRLLLLSETPWLRESKGKEAFFGEIIDIFNPATVEKTQKNALGKLKNYQNADGSFSWKPGGEGDLYITLYLLENFAHAYAHGVAVPEDVTKKAIAYAVKETKKQTGVIERLLGEYNIAFTLYASYVLTAFPDQWKETANAKKEARSWLAYADGYSKFMTPLGKIYAANAYHRLGEQEKAENYLDQVLDSLREDETAGAYFTPEARSWLWYSDTLEKHAITLRTLLKLRPQDPRIDGMLKWMMFNNKTTEWNNTKAAASAVYCLLDVMQAKGAFTTDTSFNITWGEDKESVTLAPFDFLSKPLRYTKEGAQASDKYLSAEISKTGGTVNFASLTALYSTDNIPAASEEGLLNVSKKLYLREKDGEKYKLKELRDGDTINVADEIEVQLFIKTSAQFEYMTLIDPRPAGFESEDLLSGWQHDLLRRYLEIKDNSANYFISWLPHGEYTLKYRYRPTMRGSFRVGAAQLQSAYSPDFTAHSAGMVIHVK